VTTKYSIGRFAVKNKPLKIVQKETNDAIRSLLDSDINKIPVYRFKPPVKLKIEFQTSSMADKVSMIPDVKRLDGITIEYKHEDYTEIFDAIDAFAALARTVKW
jgi:D-amino peptidase